LQDFRPVLTIAGGLLALLAVAMLVPVMLDLAAGEPDWQAFAVAAAITLFFGVALVLASRDRGWQGFTLRQGFLIANLSWVLAALFGALPFLFSSLELSLTDAFFESMSGITTTGATALADLEAASPGILMWRAILNWLGGLGFIAMAVAVLPILQVGGMQIFRVETFAGAQVLPRAAEIGRGLALVYIALTAAGAAALWGFGMTPFDAVAHAMAAISTGGFSTRSASIASFGSLGIEATLVVMMCLSAVPFVILLRALSGDLRPLLRDSQVQWLAGLLAAGTLLIALWLVQTERMDGTGALRASLFTTVSMMTGTGFLIADPATWGGFPTAILLLLMFIGGGAGSAASGVKLFRVQVFVSTALALLRRLTQPHGVFIVYFNRRPVPSGVSDQVIGFFFLFGLAYALLAVGLGLMGLEFTAALSAAASVIANVGPGLGDPAMAAANFSALPAEAKWWLAGGMLLGRLELLSLLVLLSRAFWRS